MFIPSRNGQYLSRMDRLFAHLGRGHDSHLYCSLVDKRWRDFIHWMRAASA
jgi:hypothetical protein